MYSLNESSIANSDFSPAGQFQQFAASILLIQQGFRIQKEKLRTAHTAGLINDKEYGQWVECLNSLKREWLGKDLTSSEDILFLKFMSVQYYQKVKELTFPMK